MPTVTKYRNGVPNWVDVSVPDVGRGAEFYAGLFGWHAEDQGNAAGNYTMFSIGGRSVAGLGPRHGDAFAPLWGTYVSVDDLDATVSAAEANGGTTVVPPMDVMVAGRMSVVSDPSGAIVHLWQPVDHIGCELVNEANTLVWNELTTRDAASATAFFSSVLGWEFAPMDESAPDGYQMITAHGRQIGGLMPMVGDEWGDLPSHWMVYFQVADVGAIGSRAIELGGSVPVPPFDTPAGQISVLNDPFGNAFSVITATMLDDIPDGTA